MIRCPIFFAYNCSIVSVNLKYLTSRVCSSLVLQCNTYCTSPSFLLGLFNEFQKPDSYCAKCVLPKATKSIMIIHSNASSFRFPQAVSLFSWCWLKHASQNCFIELDPKSCLLELSVSEMGMSKWKLFKPVLGKDKVLLLSLQKVFPIYI